MSQDNEPKRGHALAQRVRAQLDKQSQSIQQAADLDSKQQKNAIKERARLLRTYMILDVLLDSKPRIVPIRSRYVSVRNTSLLTAHPRTAPSNSRRVFPRVTHSRCALSIV